MKNIMFFLLLLLICSCSCGEKSQFHDYGDFSRSPSMKGWIPFEIPKDARKIEIWRNIDTNSVRASFEHRGGLRDVDGYQRLSDSLKKSALRNYPAIQEESSDLMIFYQCKSIQIKSSDGIKIDGGLREVRYIGDTGRKIFYWNDQVPATYQNVCSKGL